MITIEQARESFYEYVNLGARLIEKAMAHPDPQDKLLLSWAVFFCGGISAKITEAFLLENIGHPHPSTRLRTNTKLNELHDLNVAQMRDDGTAWN